MIRYNTKRMEKDRIRRTKLISYIKGILEDMSPGMVVVDNHGIGYQMMVPMRGESFPEDRTRNQDLYPYASKREMMSVYLAFYQKKKKKHCNF